MQIKTLGTIFFLFFFISVKGQKISPADCSSSNIESSYNCLIGKTLRDVVQQLKLDTSQIRIMEEPPAVVRGLTITIGDTCVIRIYTGGPMLKDSTGKKRMAKRSDYVLIMDKKIKGVSWAIYKGEVTLRHKSAGDVVWYWGD